MSTCKYPERPKRPYGSGLLCCIAIEAAQVSQGSAQRRFRVSNTVVTKAVRLFRVTPRRRGTFTREEIMRLNAIRPVKPC